MKKTIIAASLTALAMGPAFAGASEYEANEMCIRDSYPGNAHAGVVAGISFVKNFDGVVPQRRILGGAFSRFAQAGFEVA